MENTFKPGDTVKYKNPTDEEKNLVFVITEANGDRGFMRFVCNLHIPPVMLYRACDITLAND